jgi:hypothetical protein
VAAAVAASRAAPRARRSTPALRAAPSAARSLAALAARLGQADRDRLLAILDLLAGAARSESTPLRFALDVSREKLEQAPGFDKNDWPDFADPRFGQEVYGYYDMTIYW